MKKAFTNPDGAEKSPWFTVIEIVPRVFALAEFQHFEQVISYLVVGQTKALLIDTGMGIGNIKAEVEKITKLPVMVINTHSHFDHVGGNQQFSEVRIFDDKLAKKTAKNGIKHNEIAEYIGKETFHSQPEGFQLSKYEILPFPVTEYLTNGQTIQIDGYRFEVIATPGHSTDSICLYEAEQGWLFTGDTLYNGPIYLQLPESNYDDYCQSIKKIASLTGLKMIFAGHNEAVFTVELLKKLEKKLTKEVELQKGTIELAISGELKLLV